VGEQTGGTKREGTNRRRAIESLSAYLDRIATERGLVPGTALALADLVDEVVRDPLAPTAVTDPREAADTHVADSLSYLDLPSARDRRAIVDIGTGAGFPGLALALALPNAHVDLLDASTRTCAFLSRVIASLAIENAHVICSRAEEWAAAGGAEHYDVATARALASLPTVLEYAAPLLCVGGLVVAWKGRRDVAEEQRAAEAAQALGLRSVAVRPVTPFAGARNRHLHLYEKSTVTPARYPRRPGMAAKRPLGVPPAKQDMPDEKCASGEGQPEHQL
jgi:16S rRNA (guanine527-N7)-methyltransferase